MNNNYLVLSPLPRHMTITKNDQVDIGSSFAHRFDSGAVHSTDTTGAGLQRMPRRHALRAGRVGHDQHAAVRGIQRHAQGRGEQYQH